MANGAICSVTTPDIPTTSYILDGLSDDGDGLPDDVNEKNEAEPGGDRGHTEAETMGSSCPGFCSGDCGTAELSPSTRNWVSTPPTRIISPG